MPVSKQPPISRLLASAKARGLSETDTRTLAVLCLHRQARDAFGSVENATEFLIYYLDAGGTTENLIPRFEKYIGKE